MEFAELILVPKLDGVIMHEPFQKPVDGTLCITGHHLILSTRKKGVEELWVISTCIVCLSFATCVICHLVTVCLI
jgi:myotubularin-related protein 9